MSPFRIFQNCGILLTHAGSSRIAFAGCYGGFAPIPLDHTAKLVDGEHLPTLSDALLIEEHSARRARSYRDRQDGRQDKGERRHGQNERDVDCPFRTTIDHPGMVLDLISERRTHRIQMHQINLELAVQRDGETHQVHFLELMAMSISNCSLRIRSSGGEPNKMTV